MNYSELKQAVEDWLNKPEIVEAVPTFIELAEARFNRELRLNAMMATQSLTTTTATVPLPADWLQHSSIVVTSPANVVSSLVYVSPDEYYDILKNQMAGDPRYYTIINSDIVLYPAPGGTVDMEIAYYQKIPALSSGNPSNWLIARSPDLYLYATLLAAEPYLQNDARAPMWAASVQQIMEAMRMESVRASRPSGALSTRRRTFG